MARLCGPRFGSGGSDELTLGGGAGQRDAAAGGWAGSALRGASEHGGGKGTTWH